MWSAVCRVTSPESVHRFFLLFSIFLPRSRLGDIAWYWNRGPHAGPEHRLRSIACTSSTRTSAICEATDIINFLISVIPHDTEEACPCAFRNEPLQRKEFPGER